jgi:zinc transport system ATP-binding protein
MNNPLVELTNICFGYGEEEVLCSVSLTINKGDFIGIIGPNGSGKTTLINILVGLIQPGSGSVKIFDTPLDKFKDYNKIGYVPQKAHQFDAKIPLTVSESVDLGLINSRNHGESAVQEALQAVNLLDKKDKLITELSGGQLQRAFIAKALVSSPELLILDEPTTGVDVATQDEFYTLLSQLNKKGLTLIMVSHDIDVVVNEVNKLVCLNKKIVYQGPPNEFAKDESLEKLYGNTRKMIIHRH